MRKYKKRSPTKFIALGLVLALITGFVVVKVVMKPEEKQEIQYELIERRFIANTISATGTINSSISKSITSSLQGMKIDKVYVSAGEYVQEDQVLVEFDVSALEEAIAQAKETRDQLYAQKEQLENSPNLSIDELDDRIIELEKEIKELEKELEDKTIELETTKLDYETVKNMFDSVQAEYEKLIEDLTKAQSNVIFYQLTVDSKKIAYDRYFKEINGSVVQVDLVGNIIPEEEYKLDNFATALHETIFNEYYSSLDELVNLKEIVENKTIEKNLYEESTYNNAQKTFTTISKKYAQLGIDLITLQNRLEADKTQLEILKTTQSQLDNLGDALNFGSSLSVSIDTSISQINTQIELYEKQVANKILRAPTSGLLTSINVKEGDTYLGTVIATIASEDQFIITSYIGEYDIPDIQTGMRVLIKTDATRNEELEGEIIFVSPSAYSNSSSFNLSTSSSSSAIYEVKIAILSQNDRLRLGMNARLSIITEMKENVITVPYDAIHERDDGTKYVEIMNDDKHITEIDVVTGLEGSYYVEVIECDILEGMNVILPQVKTGSSIEDLLVNMGAGGGLK